MLKVLLMVALLAGCPSFAHGSSNGWFVSSKRELILSLILGLNGLVTATNSTNSSSTNDCYPYYMSDQETTTLAWWQVYSGITATILIGSNVVVAWWFYEKSQKDLLQLLKKQHDDAKKENEGLQRVEKALVKTRDRVSAKLGTLDEPY